MRKTLVLAGIATGLAVGFLFAQGDANYQSWMKTVAATNQSLNKNIAAKDGPASSADAMKLQSTFKEVQGFWEKRGGADDAVNFAKQAQTAAGATAKAASGGNFDQAAAEAKNIAATCGGCHRAHREQAADKTFSIK